MIVLDTHIFVWLNQNDPRLTDNHRQTIAKERKHGLGISTISLIEIARLVTEKRIILPLPIEQWFEIALAQPGIILIGITPKNCSRSTNFTKRLSQRSSR